MRKIVSIAVGIVLFISIFVVCVVVSAKTPIKKSMQKGTRIVQLAPFSKITTYLPYDIVYRQGTTDSFTVKATGPVKALKNLKIVQKEGKLTISVSRDFNGLNFSSLRELISNSRHNNVTIYITSPELSAVELAGSGTFTALGKVKTSKLVLSVLGSGDINMNDVACTDYSTKVLGSGEIKLRNVFATATAYHQVSGSGEITAHQLGVQYTNATVTGSGEIKLMNENCGYLKAQVTGSGEIKLKGSVNQVDKEVTGSGEIHDLTQKSRENNDIKLNNHK